MSAYIHVRIHFIWSTANREPQIHPAWRENLYAYMAGICENHRAKLLIAGGISDHIHLYVSLPSTLSVADTVNLLKSNSSRWIHENHDRAFAWQNKYAAFSVSKSAEDALFAYIRGQEEHHRKKSYREELIEFLERHELEYNPDYLLE
ncbi:MAG: IS200/IS605 family transposase [Phycisphaerae bacterium]